MWVFPFSVLNVQCVVFPAGGAVAHTPHRQAAPAGQDRRCGWGPGDLGEQKSDPFGARRAFLVPVLPGPQLGSGPKMQGLWRDSGASGLDLSRREQATAPLTHLLEIQGGT